AVGPQQARRDGEHVAAPAAAADDLGARRLRRLRDLGVPVPLEARDPSVLRDRAPAVAQQLLPREPDPARPEGVEAAVDDDRVHAETAQPCLLAAPVAAGE